MSILVRDYVKEWDWKKFARTVKEEEKRDAARKHREQRRRGYYD